MCNAVYVMSSDLAESSMHSSIKMMLASAKQIVQNPHARTYSAVQPHPSYDTAARKAEVSASLL